ncbi:hypothetical protein ACFOYW_09565 [Gryllotalpicola reticulitermitis]|uniref:EthD domain-containing protein n=1 Tax=Gryllotalpicola reticulitermitis TaxID=1184153 RepID=A0ABV8Q777_9MICO
MPPRFLQIVSTQPSPDAEPEFNDWYENTHVPEVLRMPGFLTGQRFRLVDSVPPFDGPQYLAVYEIESDDIDATLRTVIEMAPGRTKSQSIDTTVSIVRMYEALGPQQRRADS